MIFLVDSEFNSLKWNEWNKKSKNKKLTQTLKQTFNLFINGADIEFIAKKRDFKIETVERQIIELITKSLIDVKDVISETKFNLIYSKISSNKFNNLKEIKDILPEDISWFEIKCTLAYFNSLPEPRIK